ncbi:hypothetical protein ACFC08_35220 [Streptomyces sp. NPDC056112]|uniref:hypothetical protein n=1 Tax=Streptomyces sp. NPDC056112 TaxID=3345715 RepID=UPI0035D8E35C
MAVKPSPAAAETAAVAPVVSGSHITSAGGRFGMPHAFVIVACIVTAAILVQLGMSVGDALLLLAGAGGVGGAVVALAVTGDQSGGRIGRLVRAYLNAGN